MREPARRVRELARRKAQWVYDSLMAKGGAASPILAADTIVVLGRGKRKTILEKPRSRAEARRMLRALSGKWHRVYTGLCVMEGKGAIRTACEVSAVKIRRLSEKEIARIAARHMDKAGGYAAQDRRDSIVEKIRGDPANVVGLPIHLVRRMLR